MYYYCATPITQHVLLLHVLTQQYEVPTMYMQRIVSIANKKSTYIADRHTISQNLNTKSSTWSIQQHCLELRPYHIAYILYCLRFDIHTRKFYSITNYQQKSMIHSQCLGESYMYVCLTSNIW